MPTIANKLAISAALRWEQDHAITGFSSSHQGPDQVAFNFAPDATLYDEVYTTQFTLAAAATLTLDLYSFVNLFGLTITAVSIINFIITAIGDTGKLKIAPGGSNPINFWFSGTIPALTLECGPAGCVILLGDGVKKTLSATHRTIDVTNTGAVTITVRAAAFVGTT